LLSRTRSLLTKRGRELGADANVRCESLPGAAENACIRPDSGEISSEMMRRVEPELDLEESRLQV
jgi:hypothetical protein